MDPVSGPLLSGLTLITCLGCPGSGKTSLAHLLAYGKPLARATPTVGCNTFVKVCTTSRPLLLQPEFDVTSRILRGWGISGSRV